MFTGIVEEIGELESILSGSRAGSLRIRAKTVLEGTKLGDSIAVNGVCLTVTEHTDGDFCADVMPETLRRSNLGLLQRGSKVNLERAMAANGRFGGHIVSGHIDGMGTIHHLQREENAVWIRITAAPSILSLIVEKGSITIDGISLTVARTDDKTFSVSIIPHTQKETTLQYLREGDAVNLETDIVGKYVEKLMKPEPEEDKDSSRGLTEDFLRENGFI